jgi:hypothetical protein
MIDFRALCTELMDAIDSGIPVERIKQSPLAVRVDAALAQPEPQGPTDDAWQEFIEQVQRAQHVAIREGECPRFDLVECALALWRETLPPAPEPQGPTESDVTELFYRHMGEGSQVGFENAVAEALARYGRPAIEPMPTSERPWEREGWCDADGRCYGWDGDYWWMVGNPGWANETITHWLPHWALPVPGVEGADA